MAIKFAFITDRHHRKRRPRYRSEGFYDQVMAKWREANEIMEKEDVDILLDGGDVFDVYDADLDVMYDIVTSMRGRYYWYQCAGNHCLKARSRDLRGTAIGLLMATKMIQVPSGAVYFGGNEKMKRKVLVRFGHYYDNKKLGKELYRLEDKDKYDYRILIAHDTLTLNKEKFKHTRITEISKNDFDLTLSGHYHFPFDEQVGNTRYINPGSFTRLTKDKRDMKRSVSLVIITIPNTGKIEIKYVPLKSCLPWEKVFDVKRIDEDAEEDNRLTSEFSDSLAKMGMNNFNIEEVIETVAEEHNVPKRIVEVCKGYFGRK